MFVVVAYDIANDRRRLKMMKLLKGYGRHVQESVFECDLEPATYHKMMKRLQQVMSDKRDNVRCYHLCRADVRRIERLGIGPPSPARQEFEIV